MNKHTQIVAVSNQKGGVGKTTTVVNLATALAHYKQKVLVIDLDPQANATSGLGVVPQEGISLYRAMVDASIMDTIVTDSVIKNVWLIPAELGMAGAEIEIARMPDHLFCIRKLLQPVAESGQYDFILLDCPPSLGILMSNALAAADSVLIPMQCEYYALEGLSVITHLVQSMKANGSNPKLELNGILMTMFDNRTKLAEEVMGQVQQHYGAAVYSTTIPRNVRVSEAPSYGMPVIAYDPTSRGAEAYMAFGKEFLARTTAKRVKDQGVM